MMHYLKPLGLLAGLSVFLGSCVPIDEHEQLNRAKQRVEADNAALTQNLEQRGQQVTALRGEVDRLKEDVTQSRGMVDRRDQELADARQRISELTASLARVEGELDNAIAERHHAIVSLPRRIPVGQQP